jgi:DNA-binding CsgD family transcriptional regulator
LSGDVERARTLSSEAAAKAATPLLRALARTDEYVFTSLLGSRGSAALRARLREEMASIEPADGADAVALQTAADLLMFFEALDGSGEPEPAAWTHPFAAMLERRASTAPLPAVGLALRGLRSGRSDAQGFIAGVRTLSAHGPRYEIAVVLSAARAYADVLRAPLERAVGLYRGAVVLSGFTTPDSAAAKPELVEPLTPRESEILVLLAQGLTNKEMAQRLTLGNRTVETHVARILGKLGVNTRARAVARSLEMGLAAPVP